ncbi:MAG TPA: hypothetical protein VIB62_03345, partial [Actinomycetota bacterium]
MERSSSRLRVLALLVALMFVALTTRLWYLQVLAADTYKDTAVDNSIRFAYTDPLRGLILDASGDPIVANQPSLEIRVTRDALGDEAEAVILRLSELMNVSVTDLRDRLEDDRYYPFQAVPVAEFVQAADAEPGRATRGEKVKLYIEEHPELFPGVEVLPVGVRSYPEGSLAAHLVGQVGLITAEDYERLKVRGYGQNDTVGRAGLELAYERWLRGTRGVQKFIVNSDGEVIRALGSEPPLPGGNVHLTMDIDEQATVEEALSSGLEQARGLTDSQGLSLRANAGAVVVMDADTGAIRAMASLPTFEPSWYVKGLTDRQADYVNNEDLA